MVKRAFSALLMPRPQTMVDSQWASLPAVSQTASTAPRAERKPCRGARPPNAHRPELGHENTLPDGRPVCRHDNQTLSTTADLFIPALPPRLRARQQAHLTVRHQFEYGALLRLGYSRAASPLRPAGTFPGEPISGDLARTTWQRPLKKQQQVLLAIGAAYPSAASAATTRRHHDTCEMISRVIVPGHLALVAARVQQETRRHLRAQVHRCGGQIKVRQGIPSVSPSHHLPEYLPRSVLTKPRTLCW